MVLFKQLIRFWRAAKRVGGPRAVFYFARHAPQYVQLILRLVKDPRVSPLPKAVLVGTGIFAVSPLNIPDWIPIIGPLDDIGLAIFAITFFIRHVPAGVLTEHLRALGLKGLEDA